MPDAREQEAAYRETAEALGGRPLVIRTLDAGADKRFDTSTSLRSRTRSSASGLRLGLERPDLLQTQLQQPSSTSPCHHPLRVMFPMVAMALPALRGGRFARSRRRTAAVARSGCDGRGAVGRDAGGPPGGARGFLLDRHERDDPIHDGRGSRERSSERAGRRGPSRGAPFDQDDRRGGGRAGTMGRGVR